MRAADLDKVQLLRASIDLLGVQTIIGDTWAWLKTSLAAICITAALTLGLMMPGIYSPLLGLSWFAMGLGFLLSPKTFGRAWVVVIVLGIAASAIIAIPTSYLQGGPWIKTTVITMWMLPLGLLFLADHTRKLFTLLGPVFLSHAGLVLVQGIIHRGHHVDGLATNSNHAGGFLVLGAVLFLSNRRTQWWAIPLLLALPYTGSQWATAVAAILLVACLGSRTVSWRFLVTTIMVVALATMPTWDILTVSYGIERPVEQIQMASGPVGIASATTTAVKQGTLDRPPGRFRNEVPPSLVPKGHLDQETPLNVPYRMAIEYGALAALGWVTLVVVGLWRRPRWTPAWWLLLTLVLLSMMDYYTWVGPLGGFFWILISMRLKGSTSYRSSPSS